MSSILEALKKLEADKNAQLAPIDEPEPLYDTDYTTGGLLGNISYASPRQQRMAPLTLVLAGGIFTMLLIGISVLIAVLLVGRTQPAAVAANPPGVPAPPATALAPEPSDAPAPADPAPEMEAESLVSPEPARESTPDPAPAPVTRRPQVTTPVPLPVEVRYETYVPPPVGSSSSPSASGTSAPLPDDIRVLPMLTRSEREQYRLENLDVNMLNEANSFRPTGNAIINLEKVFVGETLPGSNAKLVDVQSHGIAIEIMSSRQRYYLPRR